MNLSIAKPLMQTADFNYHLPPEAIAIHPPTTRGEAKLLVLNRHTGAIAHQSYADIAQYLQAGDVLILNDTQVLKARIVATDFVSKASYEIFLLEYHGTTPDPLRRKVLYRGNLVAGKQISVKGANITVEKILGDGMAMISSTTNLDTLADNIGQVPLPPYLHRDATNEDVARYQTIFAKHRGSVAAPTASLNVTPELLATLQAKGVQIHYLTLHVGLGTFLPIRTDDISAHKMHAEYFDIPKSTVAAIQSAKASKQKVVGLGTTVTRALEFNAQNILHKPAQNLTGDAKIFIYPSYQFQVIDALITNFHAPKSTVLMLTAAFASWPHLHHAYTEAIEHDYRFLSYGDSMLII